MPGKVELHAHTTASDGTFSPSGLVDLAVAKGLVLLAITDHDSTEGVDEALERAAQGDLEVWPGIEISTDVPSAEVHVLGYFVDYHDQRFQQTLAKLRNSREHRAEEMVRRLADLGLPLEWERILEIAGSGAIGRPHVAQALVERGYVENVREAFARYISRNGPAYVERYKLTPVEAVQIIRQAGGLPVLAHPMFIGPVDEYGEQPQLRPLLHDLVEAGLVGMEAYYSGYSPETVGYLVRLAEEFRLIPTGGSDFHGRPDGHADLGEIEVPLDSVERLRSLKSSAR